MSGLRRDVAGQDTSGFASLVGIFRVANILVVLNRVLPTLIKIACLADVSGLEMKVWRMTRSRALLRGTFIVATSTQVSQAQQAQ